MIDLYEFQKSGAAFLVSRKKAILGDEMGLGKTRTACHAVRLLDTDTLRVGVVCPAIVRPQWKAEANANAVLGSFFHIVSYDAVAADPSLASEIANDVDILILDEVHYLKHMESKRTKAILGALGMARHVLERGGRVWALSGTPMPRNPAELYPLLACLWPKTLLNRGITGFMAFVQRFCNWKVTRYGLKIFSARNVDLLKEILDLVMLRRTVAQVAPELPPLRFEHEMLAAQSQADILLAEADLTMAERAVIASGLGATSTNISRYRHQIGDLKAPVVAEMLRDELRGNDSKIVVFAYHRSVLDKLESMLSGYGVVRVCGAVTPTQREEQLRQFVSIPARRVFLGQIDACGTGFDGLQRVAHEAVIVEPGWKSDQHVQAAARLARFGQTLPVRCRFVSLADSLDEAVMWNHTRESKMRQEILNATH